MILSFQLSYAALSGMILFSPVIQYRLAALGTAPPGRTACGIPQCPAVCTPPGRLCLWGYLSNWSICIADTGTVGDSVYLGTRTGPASPAAACAVGALGSGCPLCGVYTGFWLPLRPRLQSSRPYPYEYYRAAFPTGDPRSPLCRGHCPEKTLGTEFSARSRVVPPACRDGRHVRRRTGLIGMGDRTRFGRPDPLAPGDTRAPCFL